MSLFTTEQLDLIWETYVRYGEEASILIQKQFRAQSAQQNTIPNDGGSVDGTGSNGIHDQHDGMDQGQGAT